MRKSRPPNQTQRAKVPHKLLHTTPIRPPDFLFLPQLRWFSAGEAAGCQESYTRRIRGHLPGTVAPSKTWEATQKHLERAQSKNQEAEMPATVRSPSRRKIPPGPQKLPEAPGRGREQGSGIQGMQTWGPGGLPVLRGVLIAGGEV